MRPKSPPFALGYTVQLSVATLIVTLSALVLAAGEPVVASPGLGLPLQCTISQDCWVANYVDVDTSPDVRDFKCRARTYDGHDGVDFAIRDLSVMSQGVSVVASATGVVKNIRDGVQDVAIGAIASTRNIKGRECGNGVVIDHVGGWQTQYCHLRQGSIRVKPGQQVNAGTPIGLVGLSGQTEFPHVHLAVRRNGAKIDPFTGQTLNAGCGKLTRSLWRADLKLNYENVALYNAGFATEPPDATAIRNGSRSDGPFKPNVPALIMWVDALGVEAGDRLRFRLSKPNGEVLLEHEQRIEKTQARRFVYVGSRRTGEVWPTGTYTGEVTHLRQIDAQPNATQIKRSVDVR